MSLVTARRGAGRSLPPASAEDDSESDSASGCAAAPRVFRPWAGAAATEETAPGRVSPRRDMLFSLGDSAGFSLMVGLGDNYFAAFALALGMGAVAAGLITPVPMLLGAVLQLITPWAVRAIGSHKRWVVACASAQAASLFLMPLAAWLRQGWIVYAAATLYWGAVLATAPAWNTWIETIIPKRVRTGFFARRARIGQACIFLGLAGGGLVLAWCQRLANADGGSWVLAGFAAIFLVAAICRFFSAASLASQREPARGRIKERHVGLGEFTRRLRSDRSAKLLVYLLAVQVAVQVSGPFFAPYMLGKSELGLSYLEFMVLIGLGFLGKVFALPAWGRFANRAGARRLLWGGGLAIVPISGLWVFADSFAAFDGSFVLGAGSWVGEWRFSGVFAWLSFVQILSGFAWAGYELALLLMFFETIPREERTSLLTIYNLFNQVAWVLGSLLGAACLWLLGEGHYAYLAVFGLSAAARAATVILLARVPATATSPVMAAGGPAVATGGPLGNGGVNLAGTGGVLAVEPPPTPAANSPALESPPLAPILGSGGPALAGAVQSPDAH